MCLTNVFVFSPSGWRSISARGAAYQFGGEIDLRIRAHSRSPSGHARARSELDAAATRNSGTRSHHIVFGVTSRSEYP